MVNQTLVLIKPDGLKKSLTGNILARLAESKLKIIGAKIKKISRDFAETHYAHLKDEPFFPDLINKFIFLLRSYFSTIFLHESQTPP